MARKLPVAIAVILALVVAYLLLWPVPVDPVAWQAPAAPGYAGPFARNERLKGLEMLSIGDNHGPETVALDAEGRIYVTTHEGGRVGTVCIYQATDPEAIREHARRVGMPADSITRVIDTVIVRPDPTVAGG